MKRRLFEDLVVSKPGTAPKAPGMAVPLSVALHAAAAAALVVIPVLTSGALPKPPAPPIDLPPVTVSMPQGGGTVRRPKPRVQPVQQQRRHSSAPSVNLDPPVVPLEDMLDSSVGPDLTGMGTAELCTGDCDGIGEPGDRPGPGDGAGHGSGSGVRLVQAGGDVQPPTKLRHVDPVYPEIAKVTRTRGVVIVECVIDTAGRVVDARVLRGHPLLNAAAVSAVQQWLYSPTRLNDVPVAVVMTVTVHFNLR